MENVLKYGGWIAAVLMLICVGLLLNRPIETKEVLVDSGESAPEAPSPDTGGLLAELESVKADKVKLEDELAALKAEAAAAKAMAIESEALTDRSNDTSPPLETEKPDEGAGADGDRAALAAVSIQADMMYSELFKELNLPPELLATVKTSISRHLLSMQRATLSAMGAKDQTAKEVHARVESMKNALRDELATALTSAELEAWDEYDSIADQLLYERVVEGQLSMMAPELLGENRTLASQVLAEELVRQFDAFDQSDELYTRDNFNAAQTRALNTSLERLGGELDEEQLSQVRGFVDRAIGTYEAMAEP